MLGSSRLKRFRRSNIDIPKKPTMPTVVRSATIADIPILREFEQGIVKAERPFDETLRPDPITYHDFDSLIASSDSEVALAEVDETPIGCGFVAKRESRHYTTPATHAHIGCMFVEPSFRGQGVSQTILQYLFAWAKSKGLQEVRLTVYPENESAVRAYEKSGFSPHILEMRMGMKDSSST